MHPYFVNYEDCTDLEPYPGWYVSFEFENGDCHIAGPYQDKGYATDLIFEVNSAGGPDIYFLNY